jgi:predicted permease
VVAQVALSVVLLSASGLFVGHLLNLRHLDLGFHPDHVLLVTPDPERSGYDDNRLSLAYQELLQRLEAIPGVRSATMCAPSPISGAGANRGVTVEGYQSKPGEIRNVMESWVAPKYFATLGTPLLAGRDFSFQDKGRPRVAIINQTMARYYFGNIDPLGKQVIFDGDGQPYEIVGVAGDSKYLEMREATLRTIYLNTFQDRSVDSRFALRTSVDPEAVVPEVRRTVSEFLKTISVKSVTTLTDQVDASIVPERLMATLSLWFGTLGALLAAIGLYGLLAFTVARRINEIGIRMALGATRSDATRMVLRDALAMVCVGLGLGAPIAFWSESIAASLIPDLQIKSVIPIVSGAAAMIAITLLAAYIPARRAANVDPIVALRYE